MSSDLTITDGSRISVTRPYLVDIDYGYDNYGYPFPNPYPKATLTIPANKELCESLKIGDSLWYSVDDYCYELQVSSWSFTSYNSFKSTQTIEIEGIIIDSQLKPQESTIPDWIIV